MIKTLLVSPYKQPVIYSLTENNNLNNQIKELQRLIGGVFYTTHLKENLYIIYKGLFIDEPFNRYVEFRRNRIKAIQGNFLLVRLDEQEYYTDLTDEDICVYSLRWKFCDAEIFLNDKDTIIQIYDFDRHYKSNVEDKSIYYNYNDISSLISKEDIEVCY